MPGQFFSPNAKLQSPPIFITPASLEGRTHTIGAGTLRSVKAIRWRATGELKVFFNAKEHLGAYNPPEQYFQSDSGEIGVNAGMQSMHFQGVESGKTVRLFIWFE